MDTRKSNGPAVARQGPQPAAAAASAPRAPGYVPPASAPASLDAAHCLALRQFQDLLKQHLPASLRKVFAELTGLPLHVLWHDPLDFRPPDAIQATCPTALRRSHSRRLARGGCEACRHQCWRLALQPDRVERTFLGLCGITNFCATCQADHAAPVTLVVQARLANATPTPRSKQDRGPAAGCNPSTQEPSPPGLEAPSPTGRFAVRASQAGRSSKGAGPASVSAAAFQRAVWLLRLILDDLQATVQAALAQGELATARQRLEAGEARETRLRQELSRHLPAASAAPAHPPPSSHAAQVVRAMLDYTHRCYRHPMSLGEVASHLDMNPNYLSDLFHKVMGVTFHRYLEDLRLGTAEELLRNPTARICEVACAVGYASPNHFRNVFKLREGQPPNAWRQGLPPAASRAVGKQR